MYVCMYVCMYVNYDAIKPSFYKNESEVKIFF